MVALDTKMRQTPFKIWVVHDQTRLLRRLIATLDAKMQQTPLRF
jgi:hypothetical protein